MNSGKKMPDAFVCANDYMAQCVEPRLTTVVRGEYEAGKSMRMI